MTNILVIGDDLRSFLAVVRSLGRDGIAVHAAPFDFSSPALRSRYLRGVHRLPPYVLSPEKWIDAVNALVAAHNIALIVPCDDRSLLPLHHHKGVMTAPVAVPNDQAMAIFFDKLKTRALATACDVPIADGGVTTHAVAARIGLPIALKPRASTDLGTIGKRASVRILRDTKSLQSALAQPAIDSDTFLEAFFAGDGVGVSVLAQHGEIRQAFQHRRLQEASETGGSSSRISEAIDPQLLAGVTAMCAATKLHGVAMFEFRHNPATGTFVLLEVNARFWGSLPLAIASGVDFPKLLVDMLLRDSVSPTSIYRSGIERRDLTGEYYRIVIQSERASSLGGRVLRLVTGIPELMANAVVRLVLFDSYAPDDVMPWRAERQRMVQTLSRTVVSRLPLPIGFSQSRSRKKLAALLAAAKTPPVLLFVCHGNICRSPFAAISLATKIGKSAVVLSAGTIVSQGRHSPDDAVTTAAGFGVDLTDHRSRYADAAAVHDADIIFIFDDRNAIELKRLAVDDAKVVRLGHLTGTRKIADPYGRGPAAFGACYAQIEAAVDMVAAAISGRK